jgi:glucose-1-phosphate thymidylyltransferase
MNQAIILAAGEGQRLRPLTVSRPKVMLPIANKPILQYVLEAVACSGIREVIIVVGHRKEQVQDYFGSGQWLGLEIKYVEQKRQLGTAHALRQAQSLASETFLVISGDNIINARTISSLTGLTAPSILVKAQQDVSKYGVVTRQGRLVREIVEKPRDGDSRLVNTGIYVFTKDIFDFIGDEVDLPPVLMNMVSRGIPLEAHETDEVWLDAVYPWDMLRLNGVVLGGTSPRMAGHVERGAVVRGAVELGEGSIIRSGSYIIGPTVIGKNCEIGPHVAILPSTSVGNNVVISSFCHLANSIIESNACLGPFSCIEDSIIGEGSRFKGHAMAYSSETTVIIEGEQHRVAMGAVIGEHCEFDGSVSIGPGLVVGNHCRVKGMKLLHHDVADGSLVV